METATTGQWLALGDACRQLRVRYSRAWGAVMAGAIDAERRGTRWFVRARDLPFIAAELGVDFDDGDSTEEIAAADSGRRCNGPRR